jgi:large subunit ribosomal protein L14e
MGETTVTAPSWRHVEVGRVVFFDSGSFQGRIAAIAEIIDHKRVRTDLDAFLPERKI